MPKRGGRNHIHIGSMQRRLPPGQVELIAGRLIEDRGEKIRDGKARAKAEKADLLRPRRYVPPEKRDKD